MEHFKENVMVFCGLMFMVLCWVGLYVLSWLIPISVIYFILHFVFGLF